MNCCSKARTVAPKSNKVVFNTNKTCKRKITNFMQFCDDEVHTSQELIKV